MIIEFSQKYYLTSQAELVIPAGYKVDYLPEPFKKINTRIFF